MTETTNSSPDLDYRAAMREISSNVEVRRLMFVIANVLVPTLLVAAVDAISGSNYPPALAWLPERILSFVGVVTVSAGVLITLVLSRCQMGMVINSSKMQKVVQGSIESAPLNLLGVTANFVLLTGLAAGCGLCVLLLALGVAWWWSGAAGLLLILGLFGLLALDHRRAQEKCRHLEADWQHGPVSSDLQEAHATSSLDDTTSDVAVVVTMAAALFAGAFNAMTNIGGIGAGLQLELAVTDLQVWAIPSLGVFLFVSLALSCRMVVRLRLAIAQHATTLAGLRDEVDDPWRFKPFERAFLLYLIVVLLAAASAVIVALAVSGGVAAWISAGGFVLAALIWYPVSLVRARPAK